MSLKQLNKFLRSENVQWPWHLVPVARERWPASAQSDPTRFSVMRSRDFLVQCFNEENGIVRMSVNRTNVGKTGRWDDGISWDDLQRLKDQAGYGDCDAVEVYPRESDAVNVANMRHLFIWRDHAAPLTFVWRKRSA